MKVLIGLHFIVLITILTWRKDIYKFFLLEVELSLLLKMPIHNLYYIMLYLHRHNYYYFDI